MTWNKDLIQIKCETIDVPDEPRTLKLGWTISERPGIGIINTRRILTPVQRLYIDLLKRDGHVLSYEREGNKIYIKTIEYSNRPETNLLDYTLEPKDDSK
jgi:hypothetical protein